MYVSLWLSWQKLGANQGGRRAVSMSYSRLLLGQCRIQDYYWASMSYSRLLLGRVNVVFKTIIGQCQCRIQDYYWANNVILQEFSLYPLYLLPFYYTRMRRWPSRAILLGFMSTAGFLSMWYAEYPFCFLGLWILIVNENTKTQLFIIALMDSILYTYPFSPLMCPINISYSLGCRIQPL